MGQQNDGRGATGFSEPLQGALPSGSEREYHHISQSQVHSHFIPRITLHHESRMENNSISGSNNHFISKSTSKKISESSFLKTVFAENSEILSKHANSSKKVFTEDIGSPMFTESPFVDSIAVDNKSSYPTSKEEHKKKRSELTNEGESKLDTDYASWKNKENSNKEKSYEITEEDKKRYLAFLDKPEDTKSQRRAETNIEMSRERKLDTQIQRRDRSSSITTLTTTSISNISTSSSKSFRDERAAKFSANSAERMAQGENDERSETSSLPTPMNVYEHSPGEVYTIHEDANEVGSPTAPDGVSRLRRKSKI